MDIFSVASKQVESTTSQKATATTQTRQVESTASSVKASNSTTQNNSDVAAKLTQTVKDLNKQMDLLDTNIKFGFNSDINLMYVDVTDKNTGETIRKIPSDEAMKLSERMKEIVGMIFDKKG